MGKKKDTAVEEAGTYSYNTMYRKGVRKPWEPITAGEDTLDPVRFPEGVEPARISVTLGLTLNLGDYESAKISVTCTLPTPIEELENAYDCAREFAGSKLVLIKGEVDANLREKK